MKLQGIEKAVKTIRKAKPVKGKSYPVQLLEGIDGRVQADSVELQGFAWFRN